jgi:hypothetical protein
MPKAKPYLHDVQYHKVMKVCYLQDQILLQEQTFLEIYRLHIKVYDL